MQSNLAMDLRRMAMENDRNLGRPSATPRPVESTPRMTELQRVFRRLESVGAR